MRFGSRAYSTSFPFNHITHSIAHPKAYSNVSSYMSWVLSRSSQIHTHKFTSQFHPLGWWKFSFNPKCRIFSLLLNCVWKIFHIFMFMRTLRWIFCELNLIEGLPTHSFISYMTSTHCCGCKISLQPFRSHPKMSLTSISTLKLISEFVST